MIFFAFIHCVATTPDAVTVSCFSPKSVSPSENIGVSLLLPAWGAHISKNATTAVLRGGIEILQSTIHDKQRAAVLLLQGPLNLTRVDADSRIPTFAVSAVLENLLPNTTYHLKARASDDADYLQLIGWGPQASVNCSTTPEGLSIKTSERQTSSGPPILKNSSVESPFSNVSSRYLRVYRMTECQPTNYPDYLDNKVIELTQILA